MKTIIKCELCSNLKRTFPSRLKVGKGKYCSRKCYELSKRDCFVSLEVRKKMAFAKEGAKNPAWRGGAQSIDKTQRVKFKKTIQKLVLKRDDYTCQMCGNKGGDLQVDHIQPWAEYIDQRFNMDNCRTLCVGCHYQITYGKPMPKETKSWGHNLKKIEVQFTLNGGVN